jgi:anti-anti-sigma regulatory factor
MASFYVHDGAQSLTLRINGELTQGVAAELQQTWLTARSTLAGRELLVDLGASISVDDAGQKVLRGLAGDGAKFITTSKGTEALAQEVSRRMPRLLDAPRPGVWIRLARCLGMLRGNPKDSPRGALPCGPAVERKLW